MELFWYIVLMTMLAVYVILDGYDFGAGIIHLFFSKTEKDKKAITNAIGPFWDANEVWLIASGGVLFFAFPTLYASSFSGFYLPLMMILWLLIFRAIGLELRGQVHNKMWEAIWDKAFGISSLLLALFFGVALGNIVRGVNLGGVVDGVSTHEAHYFFLPLWNPSFSPHSEELGVIDWFTLLLGIISVVALTIHGANWIIYKTNSDLNEKLKKVVFYLNFVLLALVIISIAIWHIIDPEPFRNFITDPWLAIFPIITLTGLFGLFKVKSFKKHGVGFVYSSLFLFGGLTSTVASIFPKVLPSTNNINPDLTLYNVAAHEYGLNVGVYWFVIAAVLVAAYMFIQYKVFNGKMDDVGYGEH
ncbi:cytochrome d ubiquinol oxidase subunit II [Formosa algae]|uniref:Cytochrome d ubiquinol oxidase subunit II n=1 Tax=Formosa algae TaxID=225843 RepID=A0A9X0YMK3_9FLAO|nr:cytochrome d ubiquinol oxidase subunit II [Formosa algae]MBP1840703.1 cytochrome d ubiquinol oxidase subunit II [Formosa algae]MDQ0335884.1 cytochrome d ubiquinol oxidase subunit II [Formosa algae]OEI81215.1 cytochrome d ubiquinol oxidase subunit II [Formosa algae]PNW29019.1 cytochrome d ubiquinol oxidase subunit II [Formosa algae]